MPHHELDPVPPQRDLPRLLVDELSAMLAYWDADQRCRFANRAYEEWFGVSPESLIGKHTSELLGPLYALNRPYIEAALRGEPQEFEREIPHPKGGPPRHSLASYTPHIVDNVVVGFFVMVTDISRVRRAERLRDESEARFSGIAAISADAIISIDADQRIVFFNQSAERIFGWSAAEVMGKSIDVLIPERFRAAHRQHVLAFAGGDVISRRLGEGHPALTGLRKSGEEFPAEAAISKLRAADTTVLTVSLRDITERKRIEDERRVFAALLDNSSDFIGIADPGGKPVYLNPAGRRLVGLGPDDPIEGTQIIDYYAPEERERVTQELLPAMHARGRWSGETYFRHWQSEARIPVSDEHFLIHEPATGRLVGIGTVTRDISASRQIAAEREELLTRERQAREQLEAAYEQLHESEERFRLAIDEAPIGMALIALDGRFLRVNRALSEIVGYTAEELRARTSHELTHPEDLDAEHALCRRLLQGELQRYQLAKRFVRKDGTQVDVMVSSSALRGFGGQPLHYIAQIEDITERKRLEEQLRLSEAKSSGIVSVSIDAIICIDEHGRISLFNEGAEEIFGYSKAEALGAPLEMLIPERLRAAHMSHVESFAAGGQGARRMGSREAPIVGLRKSGEEFPAEAAISKLEVGGQRVLTITLRDVTEERRVDREQRFLAEVGPILASTLDYDETLTRLAELVVRDLADLCVIDVVENDGVIRRVKVTSREPSRAWLCDLLANLQLDRRHAHIARSVLQTKQPLLLQRPTREQVALYAQNEEHARVLQAAEIQAMLVVPLIVQDRVLGAIAMISSSPGHIYARSDLRLARELAQRAALAIDNARLYGSARRATQARDDVLGIVAHDLRNPLGTILMQAGLLRRFAADAEPRLLKYAEGIERAADRMKRLIQDLLDVARLEAGGMTVDAVLLAARQVVLDCVEAQAPLAASASITLEVDVGSEMTEVHADRDRLLQVFENLIGNALAFTPAGGRVSVGAAPSDGQVLFWVRDDGPGINPDHLPHLFDRFWQARAGRRGAGLGLPIVKGIVEAHGGRVWVESTPSQGSTFFFTLPAAPRTE